MYFYVTNIIYIYLYKFGVIWIQGLGKHIIYYYTYYENCDVNEIAILFKF